MRLAACALAAALASLASPAFARSCDFYGVSPAPVWQWGSTGKYYLKDQMNGAFLSGFDTAGFGMMRMGIEKNQGDADYTNTWPVYDQVLAEAAANGTEILVMLAPDWDMADPNDLSSGLPNTFINQMVSKFIGIANRYGATLKYYEVLNEPNCCSYVNPAVFAKLMAEIYVNASWIIGHDGLHLVSGALYGGLENDFGGYASQVYGQTGLWDWMQANKGRRYPWDGYAFHPYVDRAATLDPATLTTDLDDIENVKHANGDDTPLWLTEFGWSTMANNIDGVWVSEATQASNIGGALSVFEGRTDIAHTFLFRNDDWEGYGLFRSDWSQKPSVATYQSHTFACTPMCLRSGIECSSTTECCSGLTCFEGTCTACGPADSGACVPPPPPVDAGPAQDAAPPPSSDAGAPAEPAPGGCSCTMTASSADGWRAGLLALPLVVRRKRRRS